MKIQLFPKKEKEAIFWLKNELFYSDLDFNYEKSKENLIKQNLTKEQQCELIEEFIQLYQKHPITNRRLIQFKKSIQLMSDIYGWNINNIYTYTVYQIGKFKKKEDFEIFYYFKEFDFLHNGYNNIFSELLMWFNEHDEKIEELLKKEMQNSENKSLDNIFIPNQGLFIISGITGKGKSSNYKQLLLQKNTIVVDKKDFGLERFKEEDKNYFYYLFINLTKEKNLNNFSLQIQKNKNNLILKGVSEYIEKKLNYESLSKKLENNNQKDRSPTMKKLKI